MTTEFFHSCVLSHRNNPDYHTQQVNTDTQSQQGSFWFSTAILLLFVPCPETLGNHGMPQLSVSYFMKYLKSSVYKAHFYFAAEIPFFKLLDLQNPPPTPNPPCLLLFQSVTRFTSTNRGLRTALRC